MNRLLVFALAGALVMMAIELVVSRHNERRLRADGAVEPADDVYRSLRVAYPACFVAMAVEGWLRHASLDSLVVGGLSVFVMAKAVKAWVIASLGANWSFHVLVRPSHPLVTRGPYRYLRHPNYLAIVGEIIGMAMIVRAPVTGPISLAAMGLLLRRRIAVEERALGLRA